MKLVIYNPGTGNDGRFFLPALKGLSLASDELRLIFVEGCHHREVCNSIINPNLSEFAGRFVRTVFQQAPQGDLTLRVLDPHLRGIGVRSPLALIKNEVSDLIKTMDPAADAILEALIREPNTENLQAVRALFFQPAQDEGLDRVLNMARLLSLPTIAGQAIDTIVLAGYSRGAVTGFELAKELQQLQLAARAPLTPIHLIAQEPVPGNLSESPLTNAYKSADLSSVHNIVSADMTLGYYTGSKQPGESASLIHRAAYSQMLPQFSSRVQTRLTVTPRTSHHSPCFARESYVPLHVLECVRSLTKPDPKLDQEVECCRETKNREYLGNVFNSAFRPASELQRCFGVQIPGEQWASFHDPVHPAPYLNPLFRWELDLVHRSEPLLACWDRLDSNRWLSTAETRALRAQIETASNLVVNNQEHLRAFLNYSCQDLNEGGLAAVHALKDVFEATESWLSGRDPGGSRYSLVASLRTVLYYYLTRLGHQPEKEPVLAVGRRAGTVVLGQDPVFFDQLISLSEKKPPSSSLFRFFGGSSLASVSGLDNEESYEGALREALAQTRQLFSGDEGDWHRATQTFSPTFHAIRDAIENKSSSALGKGYLLHNLPLLIQAYLQPGRALPHRDQALLALEEGFRQHLAVSLRDSGLDMCLPPAAVGAMPGPSSSGF